ncbi:UPF0259 family protein [Brenneria sp. 4F2]|nr:UPF0259 family protein [Brenneria bubanii]
MPITASKLYRDTMNFTRNQLITVLLMSLLTALIAVILDQAFTPAEEELQILSAMGGDLSSSAKLSVIEMLRQLTPEQQAMMAKIAAARTFAALAGNAILTGGILMLLQMVSAGNRTSALRAIGAAAPYLPRLFILTLLCVFLIQLGMLFLVIPGILLTIALSLAPIVVVIEKQGVFSAIKSSAALTFANLRITAPAVILWILAKAVILVLATKIPGFSPTLLAVLLNGLSNLISAMLLIYLFRLYTLLRA